MTVNPLYKVENGEPYVSALGVATLIGITEHELLAEVERQGGRELFQFPAEWLARARRRSEAYRQATGASDMYGALHWYNTQTS